MNVITVTEPVSVLREIEASCLACSEINPQRSNEPVIERSAIAFRAGKNYLLAALDEIAEILDVPQLTRVPRAQPWVRGIANVRGNLLPIADFLGVLGREVATLTGKTRIMVIQYNGIYSGLVVDEVFGMKHFTESERVGEQEDLEGCLHTFIRNSYFKNDRVWSEISLLSVALTPQFLQAAV